jgi:HSP20 family molecular chaperone IbpA
VRVEREIGNPFSSQVLHLFFLGLGGLEKSPAIELSETESDIVLKAQVPGLEAKDLEVEVSEDSISISGEHKQEERKEEGFSFTKARI